MPSEVQPPLVLVVDDQNSNLQLIGEVLDHAGYSVMPALSGEQAIARAALRRPDLVLLDMAMPGMNGVETCRRLREMAGFDGLPILFVTAANDRTSLVTAFNVGAVDYITKPFVVEELLARVRTHLDLKQARDRLAEMVRDREDVIDVVAHDLKNPLTCVLFAAQALRREPLSAQRRGELADEIESCATEALDYIQRFLARGAGRERLRQFGADSFALNAVTRDAARLQRAAAEARGVTIAISGDATVWADVLAVRNVVQNLLSNAIRHSPAGTRVDIEIGPSTQAQFSQCRILDRGPGIAAEIEQRLFERYVRHGAQNQSPEHRYSSGLGLAIARHDVMRMGGRLWYEPREGGGSVFAFDLPQQAPDGQ